MLTSTPLEIDAGLLAVPPEWIDYNGHMSEGFYARALSYVTDAFMDYVGMDAAYRARTSGTIYTAEVHIVYLRELREGDPLRFTTQLLDHDAKRLHMLHSLFHAEEGYLAATGEYMLLHVTQNTGKVAPMTADVLARVEAVAAAQAGLPRPGQAGRVIGIRRC